MAANTPTRDELNILLLVKHYMTRDTGTAAVNETVGKDNKIIRESFTVGEENKTVREAGMGTALRSGLNSLIGSKNADIFTARGKDILNRHLSKTPLTNEVSEEMNNILDRLNSGKPDEKRQAEEDLDNLYRNSPELRNKINGAIDGIQEYDKRWNGAIASQVNANLKDRAPINLDVMQGIVNQAFSDARGKLKALERQGPAPKTAITPAPSSKGGVQQATKTATVSGTEKTAIMGAAKEAAKNAGGNGGVIVILDQEQKKEPGQDNKPKSGVASGVALVTNMPGTNGLEIILENVSNGPEIDIRMQETPEQMKKNAQDLKELLQSGLILEDKEEQDKKNIDEPEKPGLHLVPKPTPTPGQSQSTDEDAELQGTKKQTAQAEIDTDDKAKYQGRLRVEVVDSWTQFVQAMINLIFFITSDALRDVGGEILQRKGYSKEVLDAWRDEGILGARNARKKELEAEADAQQATAQQQTSQAQQSQQQQATGQQQQAQQQSSQGQQQTQQQQLAQSTQNIQNLSNTPLNAAPNPSNVQNAQFTPKVAANANAATPLSQLPPVPKAEPQVLVQKQENEPANAPDTPKLKPN